jgi:hypothetical protein
MKNSKFDSTLIGLLTGLWGPVIGFFILFIGFHLTREISWSKYLNDFTTSSVKKSSIISLSLIFNLITFYFSLNKSWNKTARGIIIATLLYAPIIVYLKFF